MAVLYTPRPGMTPLRHRLSTACQIAQSNIAATLIAAKPRSVLAVDPCLSGCAQ